MKRLFLLACCFLLVGCVAMQRQTMPRQDPCTNDLSKADYRSKLIDVSIDPVYGTSPMPLGFHLFVENRSSSELFIDWGKTYFIQDGQGSGGFMYDGVPFIQREAPKPDALILPKTIFERDIFPNSRVLFVSRDLSLYTGIPSGWRIAEMPAGTYGIYLKLKGKAAPKEYIKLFMERIPAQ